MMRYIVNIFFMVFLMSNSYASKLVGISQDIAQLTIKYKGETIVINRIQSNSNKLAGPYTKTSRPCPPYCIQPISAGNGVETIGEIELLNIYKNDVEDDTALIIDVRGPEWYLIGSLPAAISAPYDKVLKAINEGEYSDLESLIKSNKTTKKFISSIQRSGSFTQIFGQNTLVIMCNGKWSSQSLQVIDALIKNGYPSEKIKWYRGGVQSWVSLGFSLHNLK